MKNTLHTTCISTRLIALFLASALLGACGGGGSGESGGSEDGAQKTAAKVIELVSANLSWTAPVEREDDTPLVPSEISSYIIRYRIQGELDYTSITITDDGSNTLIIDDLTTGNYEYRIAAVDSDGIHGAFSNPQFVTL